MRRAGAPGAAPATGPFSLGQRLRGAGHRLADRADVPDRTARGEAKIVPMRLHPGFTIAKGDPYPRGLPVHACDGVVAGTIVDAWVDKSEPQVRYYEVQLAAA